ncbi:hypothetical protein BGX29_002629 [Mortierella sp. GBA35]|nr:hypothetical protein BGX29_002629 [Mortierella sp. GBA35]
MTINNNSFFTGETSVVLVGNPGVGKSTILNALGGGFATGFSSVAGLTREVSTCRVTVDGRRLRLVDLPGIFDVDIKDEHATQRHLEMLQNVLNDGSSYVIFFVVTPRNGRIEPSDFTVMKTLLDNLDSSPLIGLILNQVKKHHCDTIQSSGYFATIQSVLRESRANLTYFDTTGPLVILDRDDELTPSDIAAIRDYVLIFEPTPVRVRRMVASALVFLMGPLLQIVTATFTGVILPM